MATSPSKLQQAYGIGQALQNLPPFTIVANRAPTTADKAKLGTLWNYASLNQAYMLTSVTGGASNWTLLSNNGGAGVFTSLTVNGPSTFAGNITQTAGVTSLLQTTINGSLTQNNGATLLNTDAVAQTISIGTGAAAKTVAIGSTNTTSGTSISAGTNGLTLNANSVTVTVAGSFRIVPPVDTPAANAVAATVNAYSGSVRFNTNAGGGYNVAPGALFPVFTITNTALSATAAALVTIQTVNGTAANCLLRVAQVRNLTGSMEIYVVNDAAAGGNADCDTCIVNFIVMTP
jgi:hypothetical protein